MIYFVDYSYLSTSRSQTNLIFNICGIIQVAQASLLEPGGHFLDVTAQIFEQLFVAIAGPETHFGLTGQIDGVLDVLIPETEKYPASFNTTLSLEIA